MSDAGHSVAGNTALDPGPTAAPPPIGGPGADSAQPTGEPGGAGAPGGGFDVDKHVMEIKKRALLRLSLAASRGGMRAGQRADGIGGGGGGGGGVNAAGLTPAQYAHLYRYGMGVFKK